MQWQFSKLIRGLSFGPEQVLVTESIHAGSIQLSIFDMLLSCVQSETLGGGSCDIHADDRQHTHG